MNIFWFIVIGLITGYLAMALMSPRTRRYDPWGVFLLAIIGALFGGLLIPAEFFVPTFAFLGSILMAILGAMAFIWLIGLFIMLLLPPEEIEV